MNYLKQTLRWLSLLSVLLIVTGIGFAEDECTAVYGTGTLRFSLATGSPGELGLVEALAEEFNRPNGTSLCWVKAGSGASLKMLKEKKVDLVLVSRPLSTAGRHDRAALGREIHRVRGFGGGAEHHSRLRQRPFRRQPLQRRNLR